MGSASEIIPLDMFGFFELDDRGIVQYHRPRADADGRWPVGEDFFEFAPCRNRDDLKRHFRKFVQTDRAAHSFTFDCFFDVATVKAKVTMTRAFQTEDFPPEKLVMLDIREVENQSGGNTQGVA
jgi:hypothetical protein